MRVTPPALGWLLATIASPFPPSAAGQSSIELVSRAATPPATGGGSSVLSTESRRRVLSDNGRHVVFMSTAANLVPSQVDGNQSNDVFLGDTSTGEVVLVSRQAGSAVRTGEFEAVNPSVSGDGRFVVFDTRSPGLDPSVVDEGGYGDVFLFDRFSGQVRQVSRSAVDPSRPGNARSGAAAISADGRFVAYVSLATDLVPGQVDVVNDSSDDVFLYDTLTEATVLISHAAGTPTAAGNGASFSAALSADGSVVAFASQASNLVAGQTGTSPAVFAYDRSTGQNTLASHAVGKPLEAVYAGLRNISGSGRYVFFVTTASLDPSDYSFDDQDHYRFDRWTGSTLFVSGGETGVYSGALNSSYDGEWILYGDGSLRLFDAIGRTRRRVDHRPGSSEPDDLGYPESRSITADGRYVVFSSTSPGLVSGQVDPVASSADVFLYDRDTNENTLVTHTPGSPLAATGGLGDHKPMISADGRVIAFASSAPFGAGDTNHHFDVVARVLASAAQVVLTARAPAMPSASANRSSAPAIRLEISPTARSLSADGRHVVFQSPATNLVPGQLDDGRGAIPEGPPGPLQSQPPSHAYVRDRAVGSTMLVSHAASSASRPANRAAGDAVISSDGRFVAYVTSAEDVVPPGLPLNTFAVYLFDHETGQNVLVSRSAANPGARGNGTASRPLISGDGRFVAFLSDATDLVAGQVDSNQNTDAFLFDRLTSSITLISHRWDGVAAAAGAAVSEISMTLDGRFVTFASAAQDLVPALTGPQQVNVYLFDRISAENRLVSHAISSPAQGGNGSSDLAQISGDGRYVAYRSVAGDIVGEFNYPYYVLLYDVSTGANSVVSNRDSFFAPRPVAISFDGRFVAYESRSSSEIPGQEFAFQIVNVFLFDRVSGARALVSHAPGSFTRGGSADSQIRGFSDDGRFVLFASLAQDLYPGGGPPASGTSSYLYDRLTANNLFLYRTLGPSNVLVPPYPTMSRDGRHVAFGSADSRLVPDDFNGYDDVFVFTAAIGADVAVTKTGPATAQPGQTVSFTISVANVGTMPAESVVLDDPIPPGLIPVSTTGACASFPCSLGTLAVGGLAQVAVTYEVPASYSSPAPILNVAWASTSTPELNPANDLAWAQVSLPSRFHVVTPCRLVDTRDTTGPFGGPALVAGNSRVFAVAGRCGLPDGAKSLALNVTVVAPTQAGFVRVAPVAPVVPQTSSVNFGPGQTRANNAVVALGSGSQLSAALAAGEAHLILDVVGYFK